jgi:hypothetical protein
MKNTVNKTKQKGEQEGESAPEERAIVLTGGIDSTVLLYEIKEMYPDIEIIPILRKQNDAEFIKLVLDKLKINESDLRLPETNIPTHPDWEVFFKKLKEEHEGVSMIYFAANNDEALTQEDKNGYYFQQLSSIANQFDIQVSTPFATLTKASIIQKAVDDYNIDLEKLAKPKDNDKIREKAFENIYSMRKSRRLDDPFTDKPRVATQQEGG